MLSPQQVADLWASGMQTATPKMTAGANAVSESPGAAAARNIDGYIAGVNEALSSGRTLASLNYPTDRWRQGYLKKGIPSISQGVAIAKPKVVQALSIILPAVAAAKEMLKTMPRGTPAQNDARYAAYANQMRQLKGKVRTG